MAWKKYVQMWCDDCGVLFDTGDTVTWLRAEARKEGWRCDSKELCPSCKGGAE